MFSLFYYPSTAPGGGGGGDRGRAPVGPGEVGDVGWDPRGGGPGRRPHHRRVRRPRPTPPRPRPPERPNAAPPFSPRISVFVCMFFVEAIFFIKFYFLLFTRTGSVGDFLPSYFQVSICFCRFRQFVMVFFLNVSLLSLVMAPSSVDRHCLSLQTSPGGWGHVLRSVPLRLAAHAVRAPTELFPTGIVRPPSL